MSLLHDIVDTTRDTIRAGYYRPTGDLKLAPSLVKAIDAAKKAGRRAIIAELKPATPTKGKLIAGGLEAYAKRFVDEGACALSVLTEPKHFHGSLSNLRMAVKLGLPVLMKDFIIAEEQIDCAAHHGAAAVLLIASILPRSRLHTLIEYCRIAEREVVVEVASPKEYQEAMASDADLVGINNRDLRSFQVDLNRTLSIAGGAEKEKPVISLSGFTKREELDRVAGVADAFLVGSSLLDGTTSVKELLG
ncbi:MAG TPA: indole-3-glycerol-phosphate synthase [Candidatus Thermoplasmatota archaeon]|nr:indole-3-glycerol-phosphate synthase [Candidatus Thermoplasmatota archaeon]